MALVKCQNMQQDAHWSNQSEIPCIQSITLSITAYVQEKVNTASVEEGFFYVDILKTFAEYLVLIGWQSQPIIKGLVNTYMFPMFFKEFDSFHNHTVAARR